MVRYGFPRLKYSGAPLEVVHLFRSGYYAQSSPFHFSQIALIREFGKGIIKMVRAIPIEGFYVTSLKFKVQNY